MGVLLGNRVVEFFEISRRQADPHVSDLVLPQQTENRIVTVVVRALRPKCNPCLIHLF